jgi:Domain of unknown function (DUF4203)
MQGDSFFAVMLTTVLALFFGFVLTASGYRFFLVLLPIWGFFFGFGLGAQSMQAAFGDAFLATVSSWIVGFLFAVLFAMLSYLFYFAGVGFVALALGYTIGVGVMQGIGFDFGLFVWLVGLVLGIAVVVVTFLLNIQKYVVIAATSILGAGVIVGSFLYAFGGLPAATLNQNPVRHVLENSPLWTLVFLAIAAFGIITQVVTTRQWEVDMSAKLSDMSGEPPRPAGQGAPPAGESTPPAGQPVAS